MPTFALKSPDYYPAEWHEKLKRMADIMMTHPDLPEIEMPVFTSIKLDEVKKKHKHTQAFRMNLRRHLMHPLHYVTKKFIIRCYVANPRMHEGDLLGFQLMLKLQRPLSDDLESQIRTA